MTYDHSLALSLGDACLVCRSDKKRCDGQHPICGRCLRLNKTCIFSKGVHRRKRTDILEDRIDALTAQIAALSRGHDRTIIAAKLFDKVKLLDSARRSVDSSTAPRRSGWIPAFPLTNQPYPLSDFAGGKVESDESQEGYRPVVLRSKIEDMFARWDPEQEVTPDMKMHLVSIWLPFRNHFQFYMDPERFVRAISLPEDHPRSMHPSLLNALYLSACSIAGGELSRYEPIFLARLRQHLAEQLAMADRLLDFIWANVILTSYFGRLARLVEAYATITSCARFAIACGLPGTEHSPEYPNLPLIPPPVDTEEQQERVDLCHSIYMTDRCFAICTALLNRQGFPHQLLLFRHPILRWTPLYHPHRL
ncbi:hypothetical protein DL93DRAFT_1726094 [Clavulina sp. PMI_390]|nr:hypothetical protein DL93DRAFT_1726094 [Clavulina sp. PMI_390]